MLDPVGKAWLPPDDWKAVLAYSVNNEVYVEIFCRWTQAYYLVLTYRMGEKDLSRRFFSREDAISIAFEHFEPPTIKEIQFY